MRKSRSATPPISSAARLRMVVSDHRGSNSQVVDFERVEICPIFMVKIGNPEKSNT
jgi:hypothetical protein